MEGFEVKVKHRSGRRMGSVFTAAGGGGVGQLWVRDGHDEGFIKNLDYDDSKRLRSRESTYIVIGKFSTGGENLTGEGAI